MTAPQTHPCVVCGGDVRACLDLGNQPLANALLKSSDDAFSTFPLGLAYCPDCSHGQLTHFVPPEALFKTYLYASGTGGALNPFFKWFASKLSARLAPGSRVLEIACNDGSLLDSLRDTGFRVCGVDPAANLTALARAKGHDVLTGFYPKTRPDGLFDAIVAMNVCAHTPEPRALMQGIKDALAPGGVAIIQTSQAYMLLNGEFDTIYHEHYSFFTPASMQRLAATAGLVVESRHLVSVHGGSLVCVLRRAGAEGTPPDLNGGPPFGMAWPIPEPALLSLDINGQTAVAGYRQFAERANAVMHSARKRIDEHRRQGGTLALVGVAAKALTFISAAGIEPDIFLDEAELKVGRFVPCSQSAIKPLHAARALPDGTIFMIGAWNFAGGLAAKIRAVREGMPSRFMVCFPDLKEFD